MNALRNRPGVDPRLLNRFSVSRAIGHAFQNGLVVVQENTKRPEPEFDDGNLWEQLLSKYPKLADAVVIKSTASQSDDAVHRNLGMAMASFLTTTPVVQRNNVIGIGSGRGVEMTISSLRPDDLFRALGVSVVSLTGNVYSAPNVSATKLWFDADRHVIEFAKHFGELNGSKQYLIAQPLAYATTKELKQAQQRVWLGRSKITLTHVFVGVARFADEDPIDRQPAHRFYTEAKASPPEQEPFLKPIHKQLEYLMRSCEKAIAGFSKSTYYTPVAEMSNLFFFVPPPKGFSIPNEKEIKKQIKAINRKLLNVREEQILAAQMLVIAGTQKKAHALRELLDHYPVTYLCTDSAACRMIVSGEA